MTKFLLAAALCGLFCLTSVIGQEPPNRPGPQDGPGPGGPPRMRDGMRPPPNPIVEALDADRDHTISADEIHAAAEALKSLDRNGDGELSEEEFHPMPPRGPEGGPPEGRGEGNDRGRRPQPPRDDARGSEDRPGPPPDRGGPDGGRRGPDGDRGGPPQMRDGGDRQARDGARRPPAGGGDDRQPRGRGDDGPPPPPAPDPDRLVDHAMEFDANGDGNLSREELMEFAKQAPPPPPGPGQGGPDGGQPRFGGPENGPPSGGDRPQRPRRPE